MRRRSEMCKGYDLSNENRFDGLAIAVGLARVVAQDHFLISDLHDVLGEERNLASPARSVDDEVRDRESGRPTTHRLDDLQDLLYGGPEELSACHLIAHIDV